MTGEAPCRLCGGETANIFTETVLGKHRVAYARCARCGSVQTAKPHWLEEAYSSPLASIDTDAARRAVENRIRVALFRRLFARKAQRVLDFGGGFGLLCRLLRDWRIDCRFLDRFAAKGFADPYRVDTLTAGAYDLILGFEVLEHLPNPAAELAELFGAGAGHLVFSTELAPDPATPDWPYFAFDEGQHIFFYTEAGMRHLAERHGYHYRKFGDFHCFSRARLGPVRSWFFGILRRGLSKFLVEFAFKLAVHVRGITGARDDHEALVRAASKDTTP